MWVSIFIDFWLDPPERERDECSVISSKGECKRAYLQYSLLPGVVLLSMQHSL